MTDVQRVGGQESPAEVCACPHGTRFQLRLRHNPDCPIHGERAHHE
jgi:hypothetical protein